MLVTFDTLEYVNNLKKGGFTDEQADSLAKAQKQIFNEAIDNRLSTKADVIDAKIELKSEIIEIKARLALVEKLQWAVIAGVIALVLKAFLL